MEPADLGEALRKLPNLERARSGRAEDPESRANGGYRLLEALRDKVGGLLLLTATPMQLHDFELYSMIELVEPGLFNGYSDFASSRAEIAAINRAVTTLRSKSPTADTLAEVRELLGAFNAPAELVQAVGVDGPGRLAVAEWLTRCHRLSQALVRNRKVEIGGFTRRIAHRIDVVPAEAELELQSDVVDFIRLRYAAAEKNKRTAVGLVMVAFQKMLCSSSRALAGSLETRARRLRGELEADTPSASDDPDMIDQERRLHGIEAADAADEIEVLETLARRARSIENGKLIALDQLVKDILARGKGEKVLIFSQFLESIEMIRERLAEHCSVRVFHGGMSRDEKDAAHDAFRRAIQVLVSSEAGGEGRNFQFCHVVVNYDLPWNPMKIEQRIGRIDRVGQKHDVEIYNFAVKGMIDERILDVLERRIRIFTETVGALDPILESFEEEVGRIALGERGDAEQAFARLDATLNEQISRATELEELRHDFVMDWRSLQRDEATKLLGRDPRASREDLEQFCRAALGRFPVGGIEPDRERGSFVRVPGVLQVGRKDVDEDYRGSFDLQDALADERLQFFAMGHPLVESIIDNVGDPWWPPVTALESSEWVGNSTALLVDYRLELHGIRDSGSLISHLATEHGVSPAISVLKPTDSLFEVRLPDLPSALLNELERTSWDAARREALLLFQEFKSEHASLLDQERERLLRMYDSRGGFIDDRIARNVRQISNLERFGTEQQKRIIPALRGQIEADRKRLAQVEAERNARVQAVQATIPSFHLRLLGAALIVPEGGLSRLAA